MNKKTNLEQLKKMIYSNIELVFAALNIDVYERRGNLYAPCPIHGGDNPTGLSYNLKDNFWTCWTHNCHEEYNRDIFGLIRAVLSKQSGCEVSFGAVLKWVFENLNIDSKDVDTVDIINQTPDHFQSLVKKFSEENQTISESVGINWEKSVPSEYFVGRGYEESTMIEYEVGDCTDQSGPMRFRAIVPIYNDDGTAIIASTGRAIPHYIEPKFWIEPGFDKRNYLYNYYKARDRAEALSCAILVEGQGHVWRLVETGVTNSMGMFGKVLYDGQVRKLDKLGITKLVVLLDNDQPGREAKADLQRKYGRYYHLVFPKTGTRKDVGQMSPKEIREKILPTIKGMY